MTSAYVYPGGKFDPEDAAPDNAARCVGISPAQALRAFKLARNLLPEDAPLSAEQAPGLHLTAVQGLFEEAGVLLAEHTTTPPELLHSREIARFVARRETVHNGSFSMTKIAALEDTLYPCDVSVTGPTRTEHKGGRGYTSRSR